MRHYETSDLSWWNISSLPFSSTGLAESEVKYVGYYLLCITSECILTFLQKENTSLTKRNSLDNWWWSFYGISLLFHLKYYDAIAELETKQLYVEI